MHGTRKMLVAVATECKLKYAKFAKFNGDAALSTVQGVSSEETLTYALAKTL